LGNNISAKYPRRIFVGGWAGPSAPAAAGLDYSHCDVDQLDLTTMRVRCAAQRRRLPYLLRACQEVFVDQYWGQKPAVVRGAMNGWRCRDTWRKDEFLRRCAKGFRLRIDPESA